MIHAVDPVWRGGRAGEAALLASCYRACLRLAVENACRTIAFPAISCGVYGFPIEPAARIALTEVTTFVSGSEALDAVIFSCFDPEVAAA